MGVIKDIYDNVVKSEGECRFCVGGHCNSYAMQCPWRGIAISAPGTVCDTRACCKPKKEK